MLGCETRTETVPKEYSLSQNYPNPFNPSTTIKYQIPDQVRNDKSSVTLSGVEESFIQLKVYDILGREVTTLVNQKQKPGNYEVEWDASNRTKWSLFLSIYDWSFAETKKMLLVK